MKDGRHRRTLPSHENLLILWGRRLVNTGLKLKSPDLPAPLVGPSGSRPVSSAGRGRGQSVGEGVAGRGELCGQGTASRAQLRSTVRALDPQLKAPQPPAQDDSSSGLALTPVG
jgi:hypothetical protein